MRMGERGRQALKLTEIGWEKQTQHEPNADVPFPVALWGPLLLLGAWFLVQGSSFCHCW